jgi:L-ribulose-5-phosphate 4-epimerase
MGDFEHAKRRIVETARELTRKGYLMATGGNLSMRIPGRDAFAVTPSDFDYMSMTPDDVSVLDFDLTALDGKRKPSMESAMHAGVYLARGDVNAVIHTHQVYASALALMRTPIPALFDEQVRFLGRTVELIAYAPSGTGMLKNAIVRHIKNHHNAYLMQNHGALCFGNGLERAVHNVEILEKCALAYLLTLMAGKKADRIPLAIREIAFAKLRRDQKKAEAEVREGGGKQ